MIVRLLCVQPDDHTPIFLAISSPGVMTPDYFREIHAVLASTHGGPPDMAKVAEVMRRHGLTPAPPAS